MTGDVDILQCQLGRFVAGLPNLWHHFEPTHGRSGKKIKMRSEPSKKGSANVREGDRKDGVGRVNRIEK